MSYVMSSMEFAEAFRDLVIDHADWSQKTFGLDADRGPIGPLKHLAKEAVEAQEAINTPKFRAELADCFLLILDAARRSGIKPMQLVEAAQAKMKVNRERTWPKPTPDEPVEHVKE
jgi:ParB family chromosome partitioning protein